MYIEYTWCSDGLLVKCFVFRGSLRILSLFFMVLVLHVVRKTPWHSLQFAARGSEAVSEWAWFGPFFVSKVGQLVSRLRLAVARLRGWFFWLDLFEPRCDAASFLRTWTQNLNQNIDVWREEVVEAEYVVLRRLDTKGWPKPYQILLFNFFVEQSPARCSAWFLGKISVGEKCWKPSSIWFQPIRRNRIGQIPSFCKSMDLAWGTLAKSK